MKLIDLLEGIDYTVINGNIMSEISGIEVDSKKVKSSNLFVAIKGTRKDGHTYIDDAIKNGANSIIVSDITGFKNDIGINIISVSDTRSILSELVNRYYNNPSRRFNLVGITGTNGKTSVATILYYILESLNKKCGIIGTIGNFFDNNVIDVEKTNPTTPDCVELGKIMDYLAKEKASDVIMEVSSMALKLKRVQSCEFDIGVFTNISPEHLDDHLTMSDYKRSKLLLFDLIKKAVVNSDDEFSNVIIEKCKKNEVDILKYGLNKNADLYADNIHYLKDGVEFNLIYKNSNYRIFIHVPSEFAIYNTLAAVGVCLQQNINIEDIIGIIQENITIPGRYNVLNIEKEYSVIIDYAHTPVALKNLLLSISKNTVYNRIITVFGCGGDRDSTKRSVMGKISSDYSNFTVITSDNPRTENPETIMEQIENGLKKSNKLYKKILDREEAIRFALSIADKNDVVVIAGKGHETYQIFADKTIHFNDEEVVLKILAHSI